MPTFTENSFIGSVKATASGIVEVCRIDQVLKDGIVISESPHRWTLNPWDDISGQDAKVQAICEAAWVDVSRERPPAQLSP